MLQDQVKLRRWQHCCPTRANDEWNVKESTKGTDAPNVQKSSTHFLSFRVQEGEFGEKEHLSEEATEVHMAWFGFCTGVCRASIQLTGQRQYSADAFAEDISSLIIHTLK